MSTLSVPLTDDLLKAIENLVKSGIGSNKADVVRRAIKKYVEDQAVEAVLRAAKEPRLEGDLDELVKKI